MKQKDFYITSLGRKLYGLYEEPEENNSHLIFLLHGLTNSLTDCPLIEEATEALHKKGFPTFRFDYFGSDKSEGQFKDKTFKILQRNTIDALRFAIKKLGYKRIGIWGRSLGAILGATIADHKNIFALVLISFCVHTDESFSRFFQKGKPSSLPIQGTGKIKGIPILPYQFYAETPWIDALQKKHLSKAKNILIMQGTKDKTVYNMNWAKEIYKLTNEPKKLFFVPGADHAYKGYEQIVIKKGSEWFFEKNLLTPKTFDFRII
ncbi:hypothetical protein A3F60_00205 [Candidatus Roizmanbacteria bacterium RIFCSPHIGHO2_12_FULL_39_8]|uniref:Peptidase S9 prolyl oligopeptidase catalytic domain-containing protein n=1 Tax=Candidatus Roizmanbacteria bacterium RIFCSPHIGHO2_12_FULL_39_8 TaxID=1802050 RepID=A0A1F7I2D7_9BACT|nr:MAG: hypothetical protein A3F60_00205 [Candidatus Roizmanbacteria bacterium RIFCSPHIGHO2_12_FULL_39_8]